MSAPLLLIDAGNTRVKWATIQADGRIHLEGDVETGALKSTEVSAIAKHFSGHCAVISSVVPKLATTFQRAFRERFCLVSGESPHLGMKFNYPKPAELGADRLAATVAILEDGIKPAIIVQCGTATAFSILNSKGLFCGGVIAPGPQAQLAALVGGTAQLPAIAFTPPQRIPGRSTEDAIRGGVMLAFQGGVKEVLRYIISRFPDSSPQIILTGGNAQYLSGALEHPYTLRPLLVFEGLRIIGLRAFKETET